MSFIVLLNACAVPPAISPHEGDASAPATVVWQPQTIADICSTDRVQTWHYNLASSAAPEALGRAWGRCQTLRASPDNMRWRLISRYEVQQAERMLRGEAEIMVDAKGEAIEFFARSDGVLWHAQREGETLKIIPQLGLPAAVNDLTILQQSDGFLGYMTPFFEQVMLASHRLHEGDNHWRVVSLGIGTVEAWSARVARAGRGLAITTSLGESIIFDSGLVREIKVAEQDLAIHAVAAEPWPTWQIAPPQPLIYQLPADATWTIEPVEIARHEPGDPLLHGELLLPRAAGASQPAVLFLGSSVPADRYGFAGPPAVDLGYHSLTDAFARAGFVVLRFDARGRGKSEASLISWTGDKQDARRALARLLAAAQVDPTRVIVVGHGEGGLRALHLATSSTAPLAGVALLATPAISQAQALAQAPEMLGAIRRGTDLPANMLPHLRWLQEILDEDPQVLLRASRCPIFLLQGGKDFELDGVRAYELLRKAALERPLADPVGFVAGSLQAHLDHLLRLEPGTSSQASYIERRPTDPQVVRSLVEWARTVSTPTGSQR